MEEVHVVTCFLLRRRDDGGHEVLLLRRSGQVGTYRGRWAAVSGYLEKPPLEQAYEEIEEETGLGRDDVVLLAVGQPLPVADEALNRRWVVHPFLFQARTPEKVRLDWEHQECRWIEPQEMAQYPTVPGLEQALSRVYPPPDATSENNHEG